MCGISGFLQPSGDVNFKSGVFSITKPLSHRGPDDSGSWIDSRYGIGLGHCRLSIIELSPLGHQPMISTCGRFVVVFNGEIYNFKTLRKELEDKGYHFKSQADTEVLLSAVSQWGVIEAVKRFVGMFAFALWDKKERLLHLVRDRMGEKPLYYGWTGSTFLFGSELKAIRAHPDFKGEINRNALALYLRYSYIPAPFTIYNDFFKLLPGTILSISESNPKSSLVPMPYWSALDAVDRGKNESFTGSAGEAADQLDKLLRDSIKSQMVADVPLGAFLSGGIDSSTIVALMQAQSNRPVKTFTIGFNEPGYNEAIYARMVAEHLKTDHTELYVSPEQAMAVIPRLPALYDEPFSDSSQIPTFLVSELARKQVKVSLSGDGGDELFGGYSRYFLAAEIVNKIGWMPKSLKGALGRGIKAVSPKSWDSFFRWLDPVLPKKVKQELPGDKLYKFADILQSNEIKEVYRKLVSHWDEPESIVIGSSEPATFLSEWEEIGHLTNVERMMVSDMMMYLPDDILTKVDRASMGVSLEARVPFLDHRVVEFAWRIPESLKIRNGQGKWLLRQVLYQYVPKEMIERPKTGFGIPLDSWLRGPLRSWAENLLDENRLRKEGYFNPVPIREKWGEHLSGRRNWQYHLWDILMFQAWLEAQ
ncbi:MAG: asparagine synthase (glutamine-hydrolyzing) [Nitrospiria bacterium]